MEDRLMGAEFGRDFVEGHPFQTAYLIGDNRRLAPICELRCCFRALRFFVMRCSPKQLHNMRPLLKLKLSLADASSLICCWAEDSTIRRTKRDNLTLMLNRPIISKNNEYEARTWL